MRGNIMLRLLVVLMLLSSPLVAQNISVGAHVCGSWLSGEINSGNLAIKSKDKAEIYGIGADVTIHPSLSPLAIEAGFTYLFKDDEKDLEDLSIKAALKGSPAYVNVKFFLNPLIYLVGGVNFTFWDVEIDDISIDDISGKMGYQGGVGVEFGSGNMKLFGSAMYFIQNGETDQMPDLPIALLSQSEFESKGFQVRAGIRIGM
jgi:Outer membrane protein beta-barrel domain